MNLLTYKNRFKESSLVPVNIMEVRGYQLALADFLEYLKEKTEFNPDKRMVDAVELLDSITETNGAIGKVLSQQEFELKETFTDLAQKIDLEAK